MTAIPYITTARNRILFVFRRSAAEQYCYFRHFRLILVLYVYFLRSDTRILPYDTVDSNVKYPIVRQIAIFTDSGQFDRPYVSRIAAFFR